MGASFPLSSDGGEVFAHAGYFLDFVPVYGGETRVQEKGANGETYNQVKEGTFATAAAWVARAVFPAATKDGIAMLETSEA